MPLLPQETLVLSQMNYVRRFVFVHYEDLLEIRFRQLEKVTDKLFVFVPDNIEQVPMWLVRQMQDMGRDLSWISVGNAEYAQAQLLLAFHAGTLHEKVDPGVEFAILSDHVAIDSLVEHILGNGRSCVRIKQKPQVNTEGGNSTNAQDLSQKPRVVASSKTVGRPNQAFAKTSAVLEAENDGEEEEDFTDLDLDLDLEDLDAEVTQGDRADSTSKSRKADGDDAELLQELVRLRAKEDKPNGDHGANRQGNGQTRKGGNGMREPLKTEQLDADTAHEVAPLADDVVRKLIRSGNRPNDVSMLRSYILLQSSDGNAVRHVDAIIRLMQRKGEISLDGTAIKYSF